MLIAGVALGAAAFAVAGLVNSFAVFIAMFAVAGLGNTVYHPADYSLLSHHSRAGAHRPGVLVSTPFPAFSAAPWRPATLLVMQSHFGWRGAFVGAALLGVAVLVILIAQRPAADDRLAEKRRATPPSGSGENPAPLADSGWRLLLSPPIILNLCFFILISMMGGLNSFLVVALGALYGTPSTLANVALTGLLLMNALGVLIGGVLASRTTRHAIVAALGLAFAGVVTALVGLIGFSTYALVLHDVAVRLVRRHCQPLARHAGARGDAARGLRPRLRLRLLGI